MVRVLPLLLVRVLPLLLLTACGRTSLVDLWNPPPWPDWDTGDPEVYEDGTADYPFIIPVESDWAAYHDARDTRDAISDAIDSYPGWDDLDESGPEYFYTFEVTGPVRVDVRLAYPEPDGVDNDIHLLGSTDPSSVIDRAHYALTEEVRAIRRKLDG